ncbi:MAG: NUDIX hydrolase [Candidatus Paceibacterota bacterium]
MNKNTHNATIVADIVLLYISDKVPEVLLIKRAKSPFKNMWALPGGKLESGERVVETAVRELEEETSVAVAVKDLKFFGYFDAVDRDPRGQFTSFAFLVEMSEKPTVTPKTDAKEYKWFPLNDLPDLAFDHQEIIEKAYSESVKIVEYKIC